MSLWHMTRFCGECGGKIEWESDLPPSHVDSFALTHDGYKCHTCLFREDQDK